VAYNNITSRTDASALIPEEVAADVITKATDESAVLQLFKRVPVSRGQLRMPVLSALPTAYWVTGDTGLKQTTEVNWANKYLNIEELATIMPVPEAVFEDAEYDIWEESMPLLSEALGRALDSAVFFGTNAPASFPTNISASATAAGNEVDEGSTAAQGGFFGDVDATIAVVEADGFDVTGFAAARSAKSKFRAARSTQGERLDSDRISGDLKMLDGSPISYAMRGLYPAGGGSNTNVRLFALDGTQFVVGVRRDITLKMLDQAVIQDNSGNIIYNLAQQDMVAARLTFRVGWQVANIVNYDQPTEGSRYPAGVLKY
jgi:HK97 family phage major capsid protein